MGLHDTIAPICVDSRVGALRTTAPARAKQQLLALRFVAGVLPDICFAAAGKLTCTSTLLAPPVQTAPICFRWERVYPNPISPKGQTGRARILHKTPNQLSATAASYRARPVRG